MKDAKNVIASRLCKYTWVIERTFASSVFV